MAKLALRVILIGVALYGSIEHLDRVSLHFDTNGFWHSFATVLLVFAVLEITLHPLLNFLLLPLRLISFGLVSAGLSIAFVYVVSVTVPLFNVGSLLDAVLMALAFGIVRGLTR